MPRKSSKPPSEGNGGRFSTKLIKSKSFISQHPDFSSHKKKAKKRAKSIRKKSVALGSLIKENTRKMLVSTKSKGELTGRAALHRVMGSSVEMKPVTSHVCPLKSSDKLKFRKIADRGLALCLICGELFNGISSRCSIHDVTICSGCHDVFYFFPNKKILTKFLAPYKQKLKDDSLGKGSNASSFNSMDSKMSSKKSKGILKVENKNGNNAGPNADKVVSDLLTLYPKRDKKESKQDRACRIMMQGLGYLLWYSKKHFPTLLQVLIDTSLVTNKGRQFILDNLICIICGQHPMDKRNPHEREFKALLKCPQSNPGTHRNMPIGLASAFGHYKHVLRLIEDDRVDPSDDNNYAIRKAAMNGNSTCVSILLKDDRVDARAQDSYALRIACKNGYRDVVAMLLKKKKVDVAALNNTPLCMAAEFGHYKIVKALLKFPQVDRFDACDYAIRKAIENGHMNVLQVMINYACIEGAIYWAERHRVDIETVQFLYELEEDDVFSDDEDYDE